ncbi:MAG: hypothetical protein GF383_01550 [Candidatus Lokiarchaeota archaeon]|nr:hypothetical protein [Candidatus Lokiarchaeota archaeon]MBD3337965.1 hypothetical protein [Candidatus Lokiarchaeota archaeon]
MVYFITEYNYPARKAAQIGKLYLEMMKKYPHNRSIEKPIILAAVWTEKGKIRGIAVSSVKNVNQRVISTLCSSEPDVRLSPHPAQAS